MNVNDKYLTTKEVSIKYKYAEQSIYNMIHRGKLRLGVHYIKPSRRKVLFIASAIQELMVSGFTQIKPSLKEREQAGATKSSKVIPIKSRINI